MRSSKGFLRVCAALKCFYIGPKIKIFLVGPKKTRDFDLQNEKTYFWTHVLLCVGDLGGLCVCVCFLLTFYFLVALLTICKHVDAVPRTMDAV